MNDYRENYFNPSHDEEAIEFNTGGDNYNSEMDRGTEQELVPDIVERLTTRYDIEYNHLNQLSGSNIKNKLYKIPGFNKVRIIKLLKQVLALLPRNSYNGQINNINAITIPIFAGDTSINFFIEGTSSAPVIVRAYLASGMIDMTPNTSDYNGSGCLSCINRPGSYISNVTFTPTIPFKQDDELIIYYK